MKIITQFIILTTLLLYSLSCKKNNQDIYKYVIDPSGAELKETPFFNSKTIVKVKQGDKVKVVSERNDITLYKNTYGKWVQILHNTKTLWIHDSLLRDYNIMDLPKIASNYYKALYANEKYVWDQLHTDTDENKANVIKLKNQTPDSITISQICGDFFLVEHWGIVNTNAGKFISRKNDLWIHSKAGFLKSDIIDNFDGELKISFTYINNDYIPDIVTEWWCCSSYDLKVYIGTDYSNPTRLVKVYNNKSGQPNIISKGKCDKFVIEETNKYFKEENEPLESKLFHFNCETNNFDEKTKQ